MTIRPHSKLIVRKQHPYNAETPLHALPQSVITPQDAFFVRTHGTIPHIDGDRHCLQITGRVERELTLRVRELRQWPSSTVEATLQCAGNRREELDAVNEVEGTKWQLGAIGNAVWRGVRLADVLQSAGCADGHLHVAFSAIDDVEKEGTRFRYGGSIPLAKALSPEVLIAYEMNGEPLAPEHGFPVRVVVPGYIGARSVKWLAEISVQNEPSQNYFQQKAYKLLPADLRGGSVDWQRGFMLGELPVNSVTCWPEDGAVMEGGDVELSGYAIAGDGRCIERVELSTDGTGNWTPAALMHSGAWSWTLWRTSVHLSPGEHELIVRAWDSAAQTQPEDLETVWNVKGYVNNAWHRVRIKVI
jgi:sulfite oxidase